MDTRALARDVAPVVVGVIDDNPQVGFLLRCVLVDHGHEMRQIASVSEVPALLARLPDLGVVLVDGQLSPRMPPSGAEPDGVLAVRALRDAGYKGPILAVSADRVARRATVAADPLHVTEEWNKDEWGVREIPAHVEELLGRPGRQLRRNANPQS